MSRKAAASTAQLVILVFTAAGAASPQEDGPPEWKIIHAGQALLVPGEAAVRRVSIIVSSDSIERIEDGYATAASLGIAARRRGWPMWSAAQMGSGHPVFRLRAGGAEDYLHHQCDRELAQPGA